MLPCGRAAKAIDGAITHIAAIGAMHDRTCAPAYDPSSIARVDCRLLRPLRAWRMFPAHPRPDRTNDPARACDAGPSRRRSGASLEVFSPSALAGSRWLLPGNDRFPGHPASAFHLLPRLYSLLTVAAEDARPRGFYEKPFGGSDGRHRGWRTLGRWRGPISLDPEHECEDQAEIAACGLKVPPSSKIARRGIGPEHPDDRACLRPNHASAPPGRIHPRQIVRRRILHRRRTATRSGFLRCAAWPGESFFPWASPDGALGVRCLGRICSRGRWMWPLVDPA